METKSNIQEFYKDQTIFLTGGTGFIGKIIIEKLLRVCCDLKTIFLLVRPKKGKSAAQRFKEIFEPACFELLKEKMPNFDEKVRLVGGNCNEDGLGLSEEDRKVVLEETTIVIHGAASVRFDEPIRFAAYSNVKAVQELLKMARRMDKLKAFVYVSTAYSNAPRRKIEEEFYEPGIKADSLMEFVNAFNEDTLEMCTPDLLKDWPNTYTFTKCTAEDVVKNESGTVPIAVVRPAIITSTAEEPFPGWCDNFNGIIGFGAGILAGVLKNIWGDLDSVLNTVPCDFVVNNIIAVPWDLSTKSPEDPIRIYNYTGSQKTKMTIRYFAQISTKAKWLYPLNSMIWFPFIVVTKNRTWFKIRIFFQHTLVGYLIDLILILIGKKPFASKKYRFINNQLELFSYFTLNSWHFESSNVENLWKKMNQKDRQLFKFNMDDFDWDSYWMNAYKTGRKYLMKDPAETMPGAKRKLVMFAGVHYVFTALIYYLVIRFIFEFILKFFHLF